ncbi:Inositol phosphorylceramide glucuronosyltransferase 1 [Bienertia sinuspersici]
MVVLVSDGVSEYAKTFLSDGIDVLQAYNMIVDEADGWIVEMISLLENPNRVRPTRFWGVYTKLKIFNMTSYRKVVYLDADTIVIKNIEDLFRCGKFCANLKHSERLNSGVLVVEPSKVLFDDMLNKVSTLPSYTGEQKTRPAPEMERLSTLYNADVGLYMLANKWMVDEKELRVIHYTLGPLKPWDWWTAWLVKPVDLWQDIRQRVEDSLPGTGGGRNPQDEIWTSSCDRMRHLALRLRTWIVFPSATVSPSSAINSKQQLYSSLLSKIPWFLGGMSIFVCLLAFVISLGLAFLIVPRQVLPWTGLLLMYEWTFTIFFLLFGGYLRLVCQWGKANTIQAGLYSSDPESLDCDSGKGHQRLVSSYDTAVLYYGLGVAFLAILTLSLPFLVGITALFVRLGLMVVGGIVLAVFMAYASEHLGIQSFMKGLEDREMSWTRNS